MPTGIAAKAHYVCRRVCQVQAECKAWNLRGADIIVGGGWYDRHGRFHKVPDNLIEMHEAALLFGLEPDKARKFLIEHIGTAAHQTKRNRSWFDAAKVLELAERLGAVHGAPAGVELHRLRREAPCRMCQHPEAQVGRRIVRLPRGSNRPNVRDAAITSNGEQ